MGVLVLAAGLFVLLTANTSTDVRIFGAVLAVIGAAAVIAALVRRRTGRGRKLPR